ncbi:hypothetical protein ACFVZM_10055 [Streptomyces sioyaensis]|uniref:hypothetical protein n=1 Tax=Streptomyces sioyaensis TaxID=67364 RepID=UPI0036CA4EB3
MAAPSSGGRGLTGEELLALPAVIDLDTANKALMIGRSTGYGLARQGDYPVRVLRLGNAYRVPTAELLKLLGLETEGGGDVTGDRAESGALAA